MVVSGRWAVCRLLDASPCAWECGAFLCAGTLTEKPSFTSYHGDSRHRCRLLPAKSHVGCRQCRHTVDASLSGHALGERRNIRFPAHPCVEHICPLLHHDCAICQVFRLIVGASHRVRFSMGKLTLNPVSRIAQFIEAGAPRGPGGMRAVLPTPAQGVQHLAKRRRDHGFRAFISMGEEVLVFASDGLQAS